MPVKVSLLLRLLTSELFTCRDWGLAKTWLTESSRITKARKPYAAARHYGKVISAGNLPEIRTPPHVRPITQTVGRSAGRPIQKVADL